MSDNNLITETINNFIKNTKVFEKIKRVEFFIGTFFVISSAVGAFSIYMQYSNNALIEDTATIEDLNVNKNIIINSLSGYMNVCFDKKLNSLENAVDILLQNQETLLFEINNLRNEIRLKPTATHFIPIKDDIKPFDKKCDIKCNNDSKVEDELLNECYDSIPLNNAKKATNNWFII